MWFFTDLNFFVRAMAEENDEQIYTSVSCFGIIGICMMMEIKLLSVKNTIIYAGLNLCFLCLYNSYDDAT